MALPGPAIRIPLARDRVNDEAKVNNSATRVGKVLVVVVGDIGECKQVQLFLSTAASYIDREQDRPGDQTTHETAYDRDFKESQEQVAVQSMVVQDIRIWRGPEFRDPIDKAIFRSWCSLLIS